MLTLPQVTLWTCVCSTDVKYYIRVLAVLRYCQKLVKFGRTILFAHLPLPEGGKFDGDLIQIPHMGLEQYGIWTNRCLAPYINTTHAMQVHEDGFLTNPELWKDEFLDYDYLGAPWSDGVVGNGGFCLQSKKMLNEIQKLPFAERLTKPYDSQNYLPSDVFACRAHRKELESKRIKFAPRHLAMEFSTEQIGSGKWPSVGFHGRKTPRYWTGWQSVLASEAKQ